MSTKLNELDFLRPECRGLDNLNILVSDLVRLICTWLQKPRFKEVMSVLQSANHQDQIVLFKYCVDNNFCQCRSRIDMSVVFGLNNPDIYWMMKSRLPLIFRHEKALAKWTDLPSFIDMAKYHIGYFPNNDPLWLFVNVEDLNILHHFVVNMGYTLEPEHIQSCKHVSFERFKFFCEHHNRNRKSRVLLEKITMDPKKGMQFVKYFIENKHLENYIDQYSFDLDILKYLRCEKGFHFGDAQIAYKVAIETMDDLVNGDKEEVIAGIEIIRFIYEETMEQVPCNVFLNVDERGVVCERFYNAIKYLYSITNENHIERNTTIIISCVCNDDAQFLVDKKIFINEQICTQVAHILFEKDDIKTLRLLCDNNIIEFRVVDLQNAVPMNQIHHKMMELIVQFYFKS